MGASAGLLGESFLLQNLDRPRPGAHFNPPRPNTASTNESPAMFNSPRWTRPYCWSSRIILVASRVNTNLVVLLRSQKHVAECSYQPIQCVNTGCDKKVLRKDVIEHVETTCLWSVIQCAFCAQRFPRLEKKVSCYSIAIARSLEAWKDNSYIVLHPSCRVMFVSQ